MKQTVMKSTLLFILFFSPLYAIKWSDSDFSVGITKFSSTANELVYDPNNLSYKLSELIWVIEDAPLLTLNWRLHLKDEAFFSLYYKKNFNTTTGLMDDYDWLYTNRDWSHWSHHENTLVTNIEIYGFTLESKKFHKNYSLTLGYEIERKRWKAYDGTYIYSILPSGFRDDTGTFSGLGITYIQELTTPYIALNADYEIHDIDIRAKFHYSALASAKDYDTHHFRNIQFDSTFKNISMFGVSLEANYSFSDKHYLKVSYKYLNFLEKKGKTQRTDISTGDSITYPGAGISNISSYLEVVYGWSLEGL